MKLVSVLGAGIVFSILALVLKDKKREYAIMVSICGGIFILLGSISVISPIVKTIKGFLGSGDLLHIKTVIQALGIGYLTEFSADIARDAGENSLASKIEMFGKVAVISVSIPILTELFNTIKELLI